VAIAIVRSGGNSGMIVVIAIVQGGGWWLPSFRAVVGCWDSQWARYCYRYQMVVVVIAVQHGHSQLVAVVVAVSRGGDDGRWWWWPLPSFGMVSPSFTVVMVELVMEEAGAEKGLINFLKACMIISAR